MLLGIFPNAHLIVEEGIRTALDHFQNCGGFLLQREHSGIFDIGPRPDLARRALANGERFSCLVEILLGLDWTFARHKKRKAGRKVGIRKRNGCTALRGISHRRDDAIDLVSLERRNQTGEGDIFNTHRLAEELPERLGDIHADAFGFAGRPDCFERRIGQIHAHHERICVTTPAGGKDAG